jgi:3-hydroxybutyrate dehydrogenase
MTTLAGKTALVTGSTAGIGKAIAHALARQGCRIMLHGLEPADIANQARDDMLAAGAPEVGLSNHNLLEPGAPADLVNMTCNSLGGLNILVNNAGIQHVAPVDAFPDEQWDRIIGLNLSAPFRLVRHALPLMREAGWGRIVNIASVHGLVASIHKSAYIAAKHGLVGLTKTVALETATDPISCNAICPGYVRTDLLQSQIEHHAVNTGLEMEAAATSFLKEKQPSAQFVTPADIGALAVFLCSDAASQITGAALPIDGGWTAQ